MEKIEFPNNGREFFFSNVLMKVYQIPVIFCRNSEDEYSDEESSFIVIFYEKCMKKRTFAKTFSYTQKKRVERYNEIRVSMSKSEKNPKPPRVLEELMASRDSKMRRFCNYFLTLFNQKKLYPFTQFVSS